MMEFIIDTIDGGLPVLKLGFNNDINVMIDGKEYCTRDKVLDCRGCCFVSIRDGKGVCGCPDIPGWDIPVCVYFKNKIFVKRT